MRSVRAHTLVTALKTGSSMPLVVEDEQGLRFHVKTRGAGAGPRALACEALYGALADALDVPVPKRAIVRIESGLLPEGDPEIVDLVEASVGENLGFAWIDGARPYLPSTDTVVDDTLAARVLALDTMLLNVDRTPKNPNVLVQGKGKQAKPWLVDHGSLLLFEHGPRDAALAEGASLVGRHLFGHRTARLEPEALRLVIMAIDPLLDAALGAVPESWLSAAERDAFRQVLRARRDRWMEWRESVRALLVP